MRTLSAVPRRLERKARDALDALALRLLEQHAHARLDVGRVELGALGTGLVRELARIHGVAIRDLDVEALLSRIGLTVRNTTAIVLAIAGNALKAFPGLGTLGGGVLHAIAYGLVFDSLGNALAATLAERSRLDAADVETRLQALLAEPARARVERVARLALEAARSDTQRGD